MTRRPYIYADNAATTSLDSEALDAMLPFMKETFGNPSSLYSFSRTAKRALQNAREQIAECINALPEEIYFTSGGTESDNWALKGTQAKHILYSAAEHHAIINSCLALKNSGKRIKKLLVNQYAQVEAASLSCSIKCDDLVSIMMANNEIGSINDIGLLAKIVHGAGGIFHTDAVQAVGHIPIDVQALGVDMLSASAHKFNGPKGIGFLFVRKGIKLVNFMDGGQQELGNRAGTENVPAIVGMATALKNNCRNMPNNAEKLSRMVCRFQKTIYQAIPNVTWNGDPANRLPGHISLSLPDISGESMLHLLDLRGIAVSTGAACNSKSTRISHVLKAIGLSRELSKDTLRISFGANNSEADALTVANEIISMYKKLREK